MSLTKKIYDQLKSNENKKILEDTKLVKEHKLVKNYTNTDEEIKIIDELYKNINKSDSLFGGFDNKYKTKSNKYKNKIYKLEELLRNNNL